MTRTAFTILTAFLLVFSFSVVSHAKGTVKVGDTIPHDLALKDHTGKMRSFSGLTGSNGMVLVFIRSAEWCPYCQKQLIDLNKNASKFKDAGYSVVSVSYDSVDQLQKFATTNKPTITLLSDPGSASIRAFGILNEANAKGTFSYGIPHPGIYVVSKDKKVQAEFFENEYTKRPAVKDVLAKINAINAPPEVSLDEMGEDPILPGEEMIETPEKITDPIVIMDEFDGLDAAEVPKVKEFKVDEAPMPYVAPEPDPASDMDGGMDFPNMPDMPPSPAQ